MMWLTREMTDFSPERKPSTPVAASVTSISDLIAPRVSRNFGQSSVLSEPDQPEWADHIKDQISAVLDLQEGWDGFGAGPIRHDVLAFALAILRQVMRPDTPSPHITPMSHEGVQLEWHTEAVDLEIEIEEPGAAWVSYVNHAKGIEEEREVTTDFFCLSDPVDRLTGSD